MAAGARGLLEISIKRYLGPFRRRRRWLERTQWLSADELESIQLQLLRRTVGDAVRNVPFYAEVASAGGFTGRDLKRLADIEMFPVITKRDVQAAGTRLVSRRAVKPLLHRVRTGGTTGTPLELYRSLKSIGTEHAFVRRQWDWAGVGFRDVCAFLKGRVVTRDPDPRRTPFIYDPVMRELHLSTYHLNARTALEYAEVMRRYNTKALVGYPSSLQLFSHYLLKHNTKVDINAVLSTSESLLDSTRELLERALGAPVFDFYGAAERVCYVFTCEHGSYHLNPEYSHTELLPVEDGDPLRRRIVGTSFWNSAMPLIRYDTGDIAIMAETSCRCGRQFPVVRAIDGRAGDAITTPSGTTLGVTNVMHMIYVVCGLDRVRQSQVVQDRPDHIEIRYESDEALPDTTIARFLTQMGPLLGGKMSVNVTRVASIPRTASGKIQPVVSLL